MGWKRWVAPLLARLLAPLRKGLGGCQDPTPTRAASERGGRARVPRETNASSPPQDGGLYFAVGSLHEWGLAPTWVQTLLSFLKAFFKQLRFFSSFSSSIALTSLENILQS